MIVYYLILLLISIPIAAISLKVTSATLNPYDERSITFKNNYKLSAGIIVAAVIISWGIVTLGIV